MFYNGFIHRIWVEKYEGSKASSGLEHCESYTCIVGMNT